MLRATTAMLDGREAAERECLPVGVTGLARDRERTGESFAGAVEVAIGDACISGFDEREREWPEHATRRCQLDGRVGGQARLADATGESEHAGEDDQRVRDLTEMRDRIAYVVLGSVIFAPRREHDGQGGLRPRRALLIIDLSRDRDGAPECGVG